MSKLARKSAKLFGEDAVAGVGGIGQFGALAAGNLNYSKDPDVIQALQAFKDGWSAACTGNKSPAIEDRNALDYLLSYQQAYIMQRGVPEWIGTETYYQGSFVSKADGKMYVSKIDNNVNHDPDTDTSETYWLRFPTPAEVAAKVAKAGDTMTGDLTISKSSPVLSLNNTSVSKTYNIKVNDSNQDLALYDNSSNAGLILSAANSSRPFYTNGTNAYRLLDTRDISAVGPKTNSGVGFASGATIPVTSLIWVSGTYGGYQTGVVYLDGIAFAASPNNEGSARYHCVNCLVKAGTKVTFSVFTNAAYYPLG